MGKLITAVTTTYNKIWRRKKTRTKTKQTNKQTTVVTATHTIASRGRKNQTKRNQRKQNYNRRKRNQTNPNTILYFSTFQERIPVLCLDVTDDYTSNACTFMTFHNLSVHPRISLFSVYARILLYVCARILFFSMHTGENLLPCVWGSCSHSPCTFVRTFFICADDLGLHG